MRSPVDRGALRPRRRAKWGGTRHLRVWPMQPHPRAALGQPPARTKAPAGPRPVKGESQTMPRWRALRRGRSRIERQGPERRARPSKRAGLAKSRPCALRRTIPLIRGTEREAVDGRTPAPKQTNRGQRTIASALSAVVPAEPTGPREARPDDRLRESRDP